MILKSFAKKLLKNENNNFVQMNYQEAILIDM
jgi:hypothetical protein